MRYCLFWWIVTGTTTLLRLHWHIGQDNAGVRSHLEILEIHASSMSNLSGVIHVIVVLLAEIGHRHLVRQIVWDSKVARLRQFGGIEDDKVARVSRLDPVEKA